METSCRELLNSHQGDQGRHYNDIHCISRVQMRGGRGGEREREDIALNNKASNRTVLASLYI